MKCFRIANWNDLYETAESRRIKDLNWVKTPNGHNSMGFCKLLKHSNGMAHFGVWNLLLQVASKCSTRGLLTYGGGKCPRAHDATTLADLTRGSVKVIEEALPRLLDLGWLEEVNLEINSRPADGWATAGQTQQSSVEDTIRGEERTEENRTGEENISAAPFKIELQRRFIEAMGGKTAKGKEDIMPEWQAAIKGMSDEVIGFIFKRSKPGIIWPSQLLAQRENGIAAFREFLKASKALRAPEKKVISQSERDQRAIEFQKRREA